MIKRTLYFGNPCYLKYKNKQLLIEYPEDDNKSVPIEDIGVIVLDNAQITLTQYLMAALIENNCAILSCNYSHLPQGMMLPIYGHHAFTEKVRMQVEASVPLQKSLWQQTISAKIQNQAALLKLLGIDTQNMEYWSKHVKSGDTMNLESRAAVYYWDNLFSEFDEFKRGRFEDPPNNLLNYGYAILRAVIARSLVASGLMPMLGIHHRNKYNPYCLADDIMEPFRPYVDYVVLEILREEKEIEELTPAIKKKLLVIPAMDIFIDNQKSPLMVGTQRTTASLMKCFEGINRKILYPEFKL